VDPPSTATYRERRVWWRVEGRRMTRREVDEIRKLFPAYLDRIGGMSRT
jgi:hypothetical protein